MLSSSQKDLLRLTQLTRTEIALLVAKAAELKAKRSAGEEHFPLRGKTLGMIFEHSSTRTRAAFQVGMHQLGGMGLFLSTKDTQIGRGEPMADTARVLSRYVDAIAARLDCQKSLEELASYSTIPVINALTKEHHPCQILADLLTVHEAFGDFEGQKVVYVGDSNNVSNSWVDAARVLGFPLTLCCPKGFHPKFEELMEGKIAANIDWQEDPKKALPGAKVISTDVWISMGTDDDAQKRKALQPYQVNRQLVERADPEAIVLHCLPAHRNEEITDEMIDWPRSRIFDQAENKLHAQKAVLELCMT